MQTNVRPIESEAERLLCEDTVRLYPVAALMRAAALATGGLPDRVRMDGVVAPISNTLLITV